MGSVLLVSGKGIRSICAASLAKSSPPQQWRQRVLPHDRQRTTRFSQSLRSQWL
jgi:hypothetical protein